MSVGNDVVDLADAESRLDGLHPRWGERVFAASERAVLDASPASEQHRLHWALWGAKESAFKAKKRDDPETVFSPREFVVELSPLPDGDGVAVGRVAHHGETFAVEVRFEGACLHAVAVRFGGAHAVVACAGERRFLRVPTDGGTVLTAMTEAHDDASVAVRRLAAAGIGSALHVDPRQLLITGRPPVVLFRGRGLDASVSLAHHGRFVAFAGALPRRVGSVEL